MGEAELLPPIPLPRRLDRRLRLGPFPSARDAMKFAGYASAGAIVVPIGGALAWLPILSIGFLLSVLRPDGKGLDERVHDYLRWQWRRHRRSRGVAGAPAAASKGGVLRLPGPSAASVLEAGGVPIRFLPPGEARELFDRYRAALRAVDGTVFLEVGTVPVVPARFGLPRPGPTGPSEARARVGYEEMTKLLLRRRRVRRIRLVVFEAGTDAGALRRLDGRTRALAEALAALGVAARPLSGPTLERFAASMGWSRRSTP